MGLPSVFQTAPPQPASKARMTWPPVLVGGADASQKGLGEKMPAKRVERSAMDDCLMNGSGGTFSLGDGIDHLFASVREVASRVDSRMGRLARRRIHLELSIGELEPCLAFEKL